MHAAKGKKQVTLTLTVETYNQLLELAKTADRTLAGYIRWVVNEHLRNLSVEKK